jgi:hypothetical protein
MAGKIQTKKYIGIQVKCPHVSPISNKCTLFVGLARLVLGMTVQENHCNRRRDTKEKKYFGLQA